MTRTNDFQRDVSRKLNCYFETKISQMQLENSELYLSLHREYDKQMLAIRQNQNQTEHNININATKFSKNWLKCLAEPITEYNLSDLTNRIEDNRTAIYSPRIDIAITPTVVKRRQRTVSMGLFKLTTDLQLFDLIHNLAFIREIENLLREISSTNVRRYNIYPPEQVRYINTRPMHLFGIEIENQTNPKHLMGDFLNAISLSKIPIILFPENKIEGCMKMLLFSTTIKQIKEVPVYDLLNTVIILTVDQFRDAINGILRREGHEIIQTFDYR